MTTITLDELLGNIQELMDSGEGDLGRLRFILMTLRRGNPLYKSDQKYLEKKLNTTFVLVEKHHEEPKPEFELISSIRELIKLGIGDSGRLQFINETLQKGKPLYKSDQKYLNEKLNSTISPSPITSNIQDTPIIERESITELKSDLVEANRKINHLETLLDKSKSKLEISMQTESPKQEVQLVKQSPGIMPKGWVMPEKEHHQNVVLEQKRNELAEISEKIKIENDKFEEQKRISQQIEIQKSKLTQLVLNRKEYEKQVEIEKNRLEEQIKTERQKVELQTKLAKQITNQKIELDCARIERDKIVKQIQEKQALISLELKKEKQNLENAKVEREKIEKQAQLEKTLIAEKIKEEKSRLEKQTILVQKIKQDQENLSEIKLEQKEITETIRQEKIKLAEQEKIKQEILKMKELLRRSQKSD